MGSLTTAANLQKYFQWAVYTLADGVGATDQDEAADDDEGGSEEEVELDDRAPLRGAASERLAGQARELHGGGG